MNVTSALGAAAIFASLGVTGASADMTNSKSLAQAAPALSSFVSNVDFVQGHEAISGLRARDALVRAQSSQAAQRYFDFDVIITLGALAIASGAFVAAGIAGGRRKMLAAAAESPREGWREEVMQALELDLAQFTSGLRRAA